MTKTLATFWSEVHFKPMTNLELLNALAHDAKLVLSFITWGKCRDPRDPLRSLINLRAPSPMSFTCTHCKNLYIGDTERRLGDRIREHLRDVERNDKDASKPVAIHFNLPNHSKKHMAVLRSFPTSSHFGKPQNSRTKIYLPNQHS